MCVPGLFGSPPKDDSAERARAEEEARQGRIRAGQSAIDQAFAGFNDGYYDKYKGDYTGYYEPELDKQYAEAKKKATVKLASTGGLQTSAGAKTLADLFGNYSTKKTALAGQAMDAASELRSKVESNKTDLYNLNRASADPAQATAMATQRAGGIVPGSFSPLGDVFGDIVSNVGRGIAFESRGYPGLGTGLFGGSKSGSSSRVVN